MWQEDKRLLLHCLSLVEILTMHYTSSWQKSGKCTWNHLLKSFFGNQVYSLLPKYFFLMDTYAIQITSSVTGKCQSFYLQMGECKWSGRIVTGLCRSYLMHMDEHRVHTWHMDTESVVCFIAYDHMNCRWSFLRLMMGFLWSWANALCEHTEICSSSVYFTKRAGWTWKTSLRKCGWGMVYQERGTWDVPLRDESQYLSPSSPAVQPSVHALHPSFWLFIPSP